ncbi:hypothetical protein ABIF38_000298 [Bradyrhizobium japonicum]|uniref:hypothetical protein n=1 Tax=Bradyrhizobium elkanii TaxID=29448 RepID=UPI00037EB29F|nr:hypothetical protein [Bradyrhizobium elkanii]MBP2435201.1 hypothetical protein [Bradyrhizobium elkanii]MCP1737637.1 hypothetical protein [Bradyrhizobium elkanii]MCS3576194.1 hypothetical protein [Bradyrhizobium elkanii]MCS3594471.1 hypothetical protein [Bradyrhizobium elkanii]MCS3626060.1 hypothetical protein [Bradyrhizobium elkanii]
MIDLDRARFERTRTIGVVLPISLADAIEQRAKSELIAKSSWVRRALLAALDNACPSEEPSVLKDGASK